MQLSDSTLARHRQFSKIPYCNHLNESDQPLVIIPMTVMICRDDTTVMHLFLVDYNVIIFERILILRRPKEDVKDRPIHVFFIRKQPCYTCPNPPIS
jgi:hypothetical protein